MAIHRELRFRSGQPFNAANNVNGIDGGTNGDGNGYEAHTLADGVITRAQEACVRKVVATLNDLDNVIHEIANESHGGWPRFRPPVPKTIRPVVSTRNLRKKSPRRP